MTIQTLTPSITSAPSRSRLRFALDRFGLPLVFVLLCVALGFSSEYFMTWRNWMDILRQTSINGILAVGMTYARSWPSRGCAAQWSRCRAMAYWPR